MGVVVAVMVLFQVAGSFTGASVEGRETSATQMEIDLSVSAPPGGSVVAHLLHPGGRQQTVALRERSSGRYGGIVEVDRIDYVVVFELLDGTGAQSEPRRLTDIGLDRALLGALPVAPTTTSAGVSSATRGWGWLALGLATASLALVAVWAMPDRRGDEEGGETTDGGDTDAGEGETHGHDQDGL